MLNRRDFIQTSALLTSALVMPFGQAAASTPSTSATTMPWYKIVVAHAFPENTSFVSALQQPNIPHQHLEADPSRFWYQDLQPWLRTTKSEASQPALIGGLTSPETAHCLALLAQREGAQLMYLTHCAGTNNADKNLRGNPSRGWAITAARQMASYNTANFLAQNKDLNTIPPHDTTWVTWIIRTTPTYA